MRVSRAGQACGGDSKKTEGEHMHPDTQLAISGP